MTSKLRSLSVILATSCAMMVSSLNADDYPVRPVPFTDVSFTSELPMTVLRVVANREIKADTGNVLASQ